MKNDQAAKVFQDAPVYEAVLRNAVPAMLTMLMVLIYNLADTFFIGQTHDALQVAAVLLATPVFLIFMALCGASSETWQLANLKKPIVQRRQKHD